METREAEHPPAEAVPQPSYPAQRGKEKAYFQVKMELELHTPLCVAELHPMTAVIIRQPW